ncbi:hypothetical protein QG37_06272 [Candidozyma auris]|uniref:Uncharacterized protein n=1 Tax=Candidozyma auris TaxID=498019 RepID=A0A0L0NT00_CANAR|nr:hypothetical protein QG37_06272 [[Candida] auris]
MMIRALRMKGLFFCSYGVAGELSWRQPQFAAKVERDTGGYQHSKEERNQ